MLYTRCAKIEKKKFRRHYRRMREIRKKERSGKRTCQHVLPQSRYLSLGIHIRNVRRPNTKQKHCRPVFCCTHTRARARTHTHTHPPTPTHTHTHTYIHTTHTHTHTHTHHTHTHTHTTHTYTSDTPQSIVTLRLKVYSRRRYTSYYTLIVLWRRVVVYRIPTIQGHVLSQYGLIALTIHIIFHSIIRITIS